MTLLIDISREHAGPIGVLLTVLCVLVWHYKVRPIRLPVRIRLEWAQTAREREAEHRLREAALRSERDRRVFRAVKGGRSDDPGVA